MKIYTKKKAFSGSDKFINNHGNAIWLEICDNVPEKEFSILEIIDRIEYLKGYKEKQRKVYLRLILENVVEEWKINGPQDYGLSKINKLRYKWG